jgi:manganese/iron transport system ATP-binding protein/manganese/zinc/iron transport system ATP- binding protein
VLVARALVQDARVLLLDEPFSGVDRRSGELLSRLLDELADEARGLLVATHDVDQARTWDRVLCLNHRAVAFGPPDDVLTRDVLEQTYGGAIVVLPDRELGILPPHHH